MAEIININNQQKETDLTKYINEINNMFDLDNQEDLTKQFLVLFSMDEENFGILAPEVLSGFKQSLNNPNEKLALVQALNASGEKAEDLLQIFYPLLDEIDNIQNVSNQKKDFMKEMIGAIMSSIQETQGIAKRYIEIPIELCHPDARIPEYAHLSDSGMDVYALDDYTIAPGETKLIPTGLKVALPPGYELQVRPKSGRALKTKLRVANTPGTIDAGYRDEIAVIIENVDPPIRAIHLREQILEIHENGARTTQPLPLTEGDIEYGQSYTIGKGEKFAQLVLSEVPKAAFFKVDKVNQIGEDRGGGFGSTGI